MIDAILKGVLVGGVMVALCVEVGVVAAVLMHDIGRKK